MRKAALIIWVLIGVRSFPVCAQEMKINNSNYWYYWDVYSENEQNILNKKNGVKQKIILDKMRHRENKTSILFDTCGRVTSYAAAKKEVKFSYYQDNLKLQTAVYKRGKLISRDSNVWDNKKLQSRFYYNKRNKLITRDSYKYDSTFITEYRSEKFRRGKFVEMRKRLFEYYPDYSYKKITYYKKGKSTHYSVFDCNPAGESHKIKKDSAYNCVKYDVDSLGNKIKVTVVNENKNSTKTIEYFNGKDERTAQKIYDLKKNRITWYIVYKPGSLWTITKYVTYKKGRESYRMENTYNDNNECTSWTNYKKGKMLGRNVNSYNTKGLIEKSESFNKRNKKKWKTDYSYEFY
jgi:hypothetical protein